MIFFKPLNTVLCYCFILCLTVTATRADEITLFNGDVIHATIVKQNPQQITVEHPNLGTLQISMDQVKSLSNESEKNYQEHVTVEEEKPEITEDEIPDSTWMPDFKAINKWAVKMKQKGFNSSFNLSLDSSSGETEEQTFRFGLKLNREMKDIRMMSDLTYYYKTAATETTDNKVTSGYRRDTLLSDSRWFYFYESRYDFDDFESWKHRLSAHAGPGYGLVDASRWQLNLRAGPGIRKEWGSDNDDPRFEGIIGLDTEWYISKRQTLTGYTAYYPVLTDTDDYRTRSGLNWRYFLSRDLDISFLVGLEHEYQNIVDSDGFRNNTRMYTGIQYNY